MARIGLFKKLSILRKIVIVLVVLIYLICLFFLIERINRNDGLKARQYFSLVENELLLNKDPQINGVDYAVIVLDGAILKSTIAAYKTGSIIELKTLAGINGANENGRVYYVAPFMENGIQTANIILLIDAGLVRVDTTGNVVWIIALSVLSILIIVLVVCLGVITDKEIYSPLNSLNRITKKMAGGNYSERLLYDYSDEIGQLCHDLEAMRDELSSSHQREMELKKNEKFLLACISHDLKTPLAIISGTAESLKDGIITADGAAVAILNKTIILNKLIDDIMEQTKTELNEFSITIAECYAQSFFEKELKDLQVEALKKGLNFIIKPCPECIISIDKQRIIQVMQNLIGNAVKYTQRGGTITICFEIKNTDLIMSVKDTGSGISAQDLPFIFDKFYRGEKARSSNTLGSGLGLPISKYIIEKHGGKIECDTILGKGTEMRFSLPLDK